MEIIRIPKWACTNTRDTSGVLNDAVGGFSNNSDFFLGGGYVSWLMRDYVLGTGDEDEDEVV